MNPVGPFCSSFFPGTLPFVLFSVIISCSKTSFLSTCPSHCSCVIAATLYSCHMCLGCSAVLSGRVADALLCGSRHLADSGVVSSRQPRFSSLLHISQFGHFQYLGQLLPSQYCVSWTKCNLFVLWVCGPGDIE